jgi:GT2 family glycosyltransferase
MPEPISVIIPTRDRRDALLATLDGLSEQVGVAAHEVVIVDDGSTDGTLEALAQLQPPYALRVVHQPAEGVSAARNRGAREARHDQLLLLNDDTSPADHRLLQGHISALAAHGRGSAVMGRIRYTEEQLRDPFMRFLDVHAQFTFEDLTPGPVTTPGRIYTAHLSLRREDLHRAGGFNERLRFGFEDADLGARLLAAGLRPFFHPELVTIHDHAMTPRTWAARARRMGAAGHVVNTQDPEAAPLAQIPHGVYWRTLDVAARFLARSPLPLRTLPEPARRAAFVVLNQGAYARGYREAERKARRA